MPFASDTFTDANGTLLQNHTSDSGHTWAKAGGSDVDIQSNQARGLGILLSLYLISASPPGADYYVQAQCKHDSATSSVATVGIVGRSDSVGNTRYSLFLFGGSAGSRGLRLEKTISGTSTTLADYLFNWTSNTYYTLKLEVKGSTIKGYLNGSPVISVTDTSITTAGQAGMLLRTSSPTAYAWEDNFEAGSLGNIFPTGISSAEAFGTPKLTQIIKASGIPSAEVFGSPKIIPIIKLSGIPSAEVFGVPRLYAKISPSGIPSAEAFGSASVFKFTQIKSVDNDGIVILVDIVED